MNLNEHVRPGLAVIRAETGIRHQTIRTFGASGAWWSTGIGGWNTMDEILAYLHTGKGIALNNYRHNVGGGREGGPLADDKSGPDPWRAVPCPLRADGTIDVTADAGGWRVLRKVNALGTVDDITLFMNSPPESMTVNGKTYGSPTGSNLREDCFEAYAAFCADVTKAYLDAGIPVKYISPVNEPQSQWDAGWQEGCYFSPEQIFHLSRLLLGELDKRGLSVRLSLNESAEMLNREYVYDFYRDLLADDTIYPRLDHFAAHGYHASLEQKKAFYRFAQDTAAALGKPMLPINQTEWAAWHQTEQLTEARRLTMTGRSIYDDFTGLHADTWEYFAAVARGDDALIVVSDEEPGAFRLTRHFWAVGNYSKFIKGYTRVQVEETGLAEGVVGSAYLAPDGGRLVFVTVNETGEDQAVTLAGVPEGSLGEVYETSMERTCETAKGCMSADNGYILPAQSVTTFVFRLG